MAIVSCQDVDRLMTSYLDAEVEDGDRQAVERHLGVCPPCARRAASEEAARRVVMARAATLSPRAPNALRQKCAALAARRRQQPWWTAVGWRFSGLATASLAVVGLAATITYGVITHSPTLLVAELTLDHLKCFALFEPRVTVADPATVARQLQADYGWQLAIPASLPRERLTLIGARRCFSTDGKVAHVLYRHGGRPVSLFMMPRTSREEARVAMAGHVARIWSRGATTYVLLGSESEPAMQPVATYFQAARF
jgi:anti-sigma factor RsiW